MRRVSRALRADRGSGTVLAAGAAVLLVLVTGVLLLVGAALAGSSRARTAADLAALAGAGELLRGARGSGACATAGTVAHDNGAELLSCTVDPGSPTSSLVVEVGVLVPSLGDAQARARARAGGVPAEG